MHNNKLFIVAAAVYVIVNVLMVGYLILLQLDAVKQRQTIRNQNDFVVCILQVQPAQRDQGTIDQCRKESGVKR